MTTLLLCCDVAMERRAAMAEEKTVERNEKDLDCIELDFDVVPTAEELEEAEKEAGGEA